MVTRGDRPPGAGASACADAPSLQISTNGEGCRRLPKLVSHHDRPTSTPKINAFQSMSAAPVYDCACLWLAAVTPSLQQFIQKLAAVLVFGVLVALSAVVVVAHVTAACQQATGTIGNGTVCGSPYGE